MSLRVSTRILFSLRHPLTRCSHVVVNEARLNRRFRSEEGSESDTNQVIVKATSPATLASRCTWFERSKVGCEDESSKVYVSTVLAIEQVERG